MTVCIQRRSQIHNEGLCPIDPTGTQKGASWKLQAAADAFLAALWRGIRAKTGLFDVMAFYIRMAPCDELGKSAPADHAYWTDQRWLEKGRNYFVNVPVNQIYPSLGVAAEWYMR